MVLKEIKKNQKLKYGNGKKTDINAIAITETSPGKRNLSFSLSIECTMLIILLE